MKNSLLRFASVSVLMATVSFADVIPFSTGFSGVEPDLTDGGSGWSAGDRSGGATFVESAGFARFSSGSSGGTAYAQLQWTDDPRAVAAGSYHFSFVLTPTGPGSNSVVQLLGIGRSDEPSPFFHRVSLRDLSEFNGGKPVFQIEALFTDDGFTPQNTIASVTLDGTHTFDMVFSVGSGVSGNGWIISVDGAEMINQLSIVSAGNDARPSNTLQFGGGSCSVGGWQLDFDSFSVSAEEP